MFKITITIEQLLNEELETAEAPDLDAVIRCVSAEYAKTDLSVAGFLYQVRNQLGLKSIRTPQTLRDLCKYMDAADRADDLIDAAKEVASLFQRVGDDDNT